MRLLLTFWRTLQNGPSNRQHPQEESFCSERHDLQLLGLRYRIHWSMEAYAGIGAAECPEERALDCRGMGGKYPAERDNAEVLKLEKKCAKQNSRK